MREKFYNCSSLTSLNLFNFNTNNVKDMNDIFRNCSFLILFELSNLNAKNFNNKNYMLYGLNKKCNVICNDKKILS